MTSSAVQHFDRRIAELYERRRELADGLPLEVFDRSLLGASIQSSIAWQRFGRSMAQAIQRVTARRA